MKQISPKPRRRRACNDPAAIARSLFEYMSRSGDPLAAEWASGLLSGTFLCSEDAPPPPQPPPPPQK